MTRYLLTTDRIDTELTKLVRSNMSLMTAIKWEPSLISIDTKLSIVNIGFFFITCERDLETLKISMHFYTMQPKRLIGHSHTILPC